MRPDFNKCEVIANELLLTQNIDQFPIDVRTFQFNSFIHFDTMQNYCDLTGLQLSDLIINDNLRDGFNIINPEMSLILYNDTISCAERIQWTLAHELGHVLLKHKSDYGDDEIEAHFFASKLFMPDIVLQELMQCGISININFLTLHFGVSVEAAEKRIKTFKKRIINKREAAYFSPDDYNYNDIILDKFQKYINTVAPLRKKNDLSTDDGLLRWMNYK